MTGGDRPAGDELDRAIAETMTGMRRASGDELAALGVELVDLLDRRQTMQDQAIADVRRTTSRLDLAVRALGGAASRKELLQRACLALAQVCSAERVVLSGIYAGHAVPIAMHDAGGDVALPSEFDVVPESGEARALRSGYVRWPTEPVAELRSMFPAGCSIHAVRIDASPAALLHVDAEIDTVRHDSIAVCAEMLGACFRRLGLVARRSRQLELLRASARSWTGDWDAAALVDPPAVGARPAPQPVESLTDRETEVLGLILTGASNSVIATELVITVDTVKSHVKRILRKLGATNRSELIARHTDVTVTPARNRRPSP
jgi:DNA-binding CsgD family transcriptional regulator